MRPKPDIIFYGTADFSVPFLHALIRAGMSPALVVTKPDKPQGRHQELVPGPAKRAALDAGIEVFQPKKLLAQAAQDRISSMDADVAIVVAYGALIPRAVLDIPRKGTLNIHPSLLPKYRGPSPIQHAILNGDAETGVTLMLLDEDMDHGPIIKQITVPVEERETAPALHHRLAQKGAEMLTGALPAYLAGNMAPIPQDHAKATYVPLLKREHGRVDWNSTADEIDRQIRAFTPWPGAYAMLQAEDAEGNQIKILRARPAQAEKPMKPGTVSAKPGQGLFVACGQGWLSIESLQPAGKKAMTAEAFMAGRRDIHGTRFS